MHLLTEALGEDSDRWCARRRALTSAPAPGPTDPSTTLPTVAPTKGRSISVRAAALVILTTAVLSSGITSGAWLVVRAVTPSPNTPGELIEPMDGVDPMKTRCREDDVVAASEQRLEGAVQVQMLYSTSCMAAWARVTRYDGLSSGNSIRMRVYPADDPNSSRSQERRAQNVQSMYTPMLVGPNVEARVCGIAEVTTGGSTVIELGPEICI